MKAISILSRFFPEGATSALGLGLMFVLIILAPIFSACTPIEKCDTSNTARKMILRDLTVTEAITLKTPATLSDESGVCPIYFEYEQNGKFVHASAVGDIIHGVKISKETAAINGCESNPDPSFHRDCENHRAVANNRERQDNEK